MSTEEMIAEMEAQWLEDDLFDDSTDVPLELDYTTQS
jgi:hypothetical protein